MKKFSYKKIKIIGLLVILFLLTSIPAYGFHSKTPIESIDLKEGAETKNIELHLSFSDPVIEKYGNYWIVKVKETNHNRWVLFNIPIVNYIFTKWA